MKKFNEFINENKYYNKTLNPKFWNEDMEFNSRIKGKLLVIANDFYKDLDINAEIKDIELTGSLANYNWNDKSDLDVHILIDFKDVNKDEELVKKAVDNYRFIWNLKHDITIKGHDVEVYVQNESEPHTSSGLYSLLNNEWIKKPKYNEPNVDDEGIQKKFEAYASIIDKLEEKSHENLTMDEIDRCLRYTKKIIKKIMDDRQEGLYNSGDAEFSVENLVFKKLRNTDYMEKLFDLSNVFYDKQFVQ